MVGATANFILAILLSQAQAYDSSEKRQQWNPRTNKKQIPIEEKENLQQWASLDQNKNSFIENSENEKSIFETLFNVTLDIDGRVTGRHHVHHSDNSLNFTIGHTWNGFSVQRSTKISLKKGVGNSVEVVVVAPYFGDPAPPGGKYGRPYTHLWNYEAVELFFLNKRNQYFELQMGPHGQYLTVFLSGHRHMIGY